MRNFYFLYVQLLLACLCSWHSLHAQLTITATNNTYAIPGGVSSHTNSHHYTLEYPGLVRPHKYFVNFGNGQYKMGLFSLNPEWPTTINHNYTAAGTYRATGTIKPIYSDDESSGKHASVEMDIPDGGALLTTAAISPETMATMGNESVRLNSFIDLVPNDTVIYIINYKTCKTGGNLDATFCTLYFDANVLNFIRDETYNGETASNGAPDPELGTPRTYTIPDALSNNPRTIIAYFKIKASTPLNKTVFTHLQGDVNLNCNTNFQSIRHTVKGSHDPNTKIALTPVICKTTDTKVHYRIEFENFGNLPVEDITITDELTSWFNPSSVVVEDYKFFVDEINIDVFNSKINFNINDISLRGAGEPGFGRSFSSEDTRGWVDFSDEYNSTLPNCVQIPNQAKIIFADHRPIKTPVSLVEVQNKNCSTCTGTGGTLILPESYSIEEGENIVLEPEYTVYNKFKWYPETGLSDPNIDKPTAQPTETTTYTLIAYKSGVPSAIAQTTVFVNTCEKGKSVLITIDTTDGTLCHDSNDGWIKLQASGSLTKGYTWYWEGNDKKQFTTSGLKNEIFNTYTAHPGWNTIWVKNEEGCTDTVDIFIPQRQPITINFDYDACKEKITALPSGGAGTPYTFEWSNLKTTQTITKVSPSNSTYSVTVTDPYGCTNSANFTPKAAYINIRAFLQGAYNDKSTNNNNSAQMNTKLQQSKLIPLYQPFDATPWSYNGNESFTLGYVPYDVVDWVLVEIYDKTNLKLKAQKAATLLSNGSIRMADQYPDFPNQKIFSFDSNKIDPCETYYVVLRFRNHLAVASSIPLTLGPLQLHDFTAENAALGSNQTVKLTENLWGLLAGDMNADGVITVADFNIYKPESSKIKLYLRSDLNLDGNVTVADFNFYKANSSKIGHPLIKY